MNCRNLLKLCFSVTLFLFFSHLAGAQPAILWEAFNDYAPTDGITSPNATGYILRITDDGGVLKDINTGLDLEASVIAVVEGADPDAFGANSQVDTNSPADKLFRGKVDIGNDGIPGLRNSAATILTLKFTGLDPTKRYNFRGTASRGGSYNDRWSLFTIVGADAYVAAHEDGSANLNIITKSTFPAGALETNQVALNTGHNKQGSLVGWDNIEPGADGTFEIAAQQYIGPAPFGTPSAAAYAYGFTAIYLAKVESTGNLRLTENPASQDIPAGQSATLRVAATSDQSISYQWQKTAPGTTNFTDIPGATQATYTTPALTVADHETRFRANLTSGASRATSGEATIRVDGTIPSVTAVRASINFNAIYLTFSEPMKLDMLANPSNYTVSGGLSITSAVALDSVNARLLLGNSQTTGTTYSVTVKNIQDIAGNPVSANAGGTFPAFSVQTGTVGLEIWRDVAGGAVLDLRNSPRYPSAPDVDYATTTLNSELVIPSGPLNTYGGRFRAWLTPEEAGEYEFFIRADDTGEFRISLDDKFDNLDNPDILPDAVDTSAGDTFQEPGVDLSTSVPIALEKGKRYAIQAIWKEGNGNDYCQVAWRKVGDATPADQLQPIPSRFLSYFGPPAAAQAELKISYDGTQVTVRWTGPVLQSSDDLVTWRDEVGAANPLLVTPVGKKFYRVRN